MAKRGRPSKAELAERAAKQAEFERRMAEMEEIHQQAIRVTQPHLDAINNILDNIELGDYSRKWNDRWTNNNILSENRISISSADFGGCGYHKDFFYRIFVSFDHNKKEFVSRVSQCRMGDLKEDEMNNLISETNNIKSMLEKIKVATDKVMDYAKVNGIELY